MKKIKLNWTYKYLLMISIFSLLSNGILAQEIEEIINVTKDLGESVLIDIHNSDFDLEYKTWSKQKLKIDYTIYIKAKDQETLRKFQLEFKKEIMKQLADSKSAKINISYPFKRVIRRNDNIKLTFRNSNKTYHLKEFDASIIIHGPKKNALKLSGSFCNMSIEDLEADATIKVSSGKFEMGNCKKLSLESSFCSNMKVGNVESAKIKLSSTGLYLGEIAKDLELNSSFSNSEIGKIGGDAKIKLSSGSFKSADINYLELQASFARQFEINNVNRAVISSFSSSKFDANIVNTLLVNNASFSTFTINTADKLNITKSSSSKFYITNAGSVDAPHCSFTDFKVSNLKKRFISRASSGSIKLRNVVSGFEKIDINGQFATIDVETDEGASFKVRAELDFPNFRYKDITVSNSQKGMTSETIEGWKGNKNSPASIIFNCKSCNINLN